MKRFFQFHLLSPYINLLFLAIIISVLHPFSLLGTEKEEEAMARMNLLVLALAILMMVSCCMAADRKVTKVQDVVNCEAGMNEPCLKMGHFVVMQAHTIR
ncbi:hypothetical protein V6N13_010884 [Hibiscus sabdariffa]|uniref:Uncharacterized protein n=1 Tax=Hibiscus sabdariffa TaxID=183260 RepID=A0ABR2SAK0_9ROSI